MAAVLWGAGLVLCVEGLILALAPRRLEEALEFLRRLSPEARRLLGLGTLAGGVALLSVARAAGL